MFSPPGRGNVPGVETRPFLVTSEFWAIAIVIAGLGIAAATSDGIDAALFATLAGVAFAGYVLSRGFAKANSPDRTYDPRERLFHALGRDGHVSRRRSEESRTP